MGAPPKEITESQWYPLFLILCVIMACGGTLADDLYKKIKNFIKNKFWGH
jgi:hypothetical protein